MIKKLKNIILIFVFNLFLIPQQAIAINKFDTSYQVYYHVSQNGDTKVTFVVTQKNNLSIVYATEYGISLNETNIKNLKVIDGSTLVSNPTVVNSQNQTIISFPFVNKVVGKGKTRTFSIEYETPNIVSKQGNTWQIDIPRFESNENISEQTAVLSLPKNFPKPAYIDPKPDIINDDNYYFSSKSTANKPISAIFGNSQYYQAKIDYVLTNEISSPVQKNITLIPNTAYQKVYYQSIEPKPDNIFEDKDGNLLASYKLAPNQKLQISATLYINTYFQPSQISPEAATSQTNESKIWDYNSVEFSTPEIKNLTSAKAIFDYVTNTLKYDYQKIDLNGTKRQPSSQVIKNPLNSICTDFADLFVSIARKQNIPARELEGVAISANQDLKPIADKVDLLHAWADYYDTDKKMWIQVDPTWANTTKGLDYFSKLDFNHIVFAIHGEDPEYPLPAGSFKADDKTKKQIDIKPIEETNFPQTMPQTTMASSSIGSITLNIVNNSGSYFTGDLQLPENSLTKEHYQTINILPFSQINLKITTKPLSLFDPNSQEVIIFINGQKQSLRVNSQQGESSFIFAAGGIFLGVVTLTARSLLLRRRRKKSSIHR